MEQHHSFPDPWPLTPHPPPSPLCVAHSNSHPSPNPISNQTLQRRRPGPPVSINVCVCLCVTKWPQQVTPYWAHTTNKSHHWSMSPDSQKDSREKDQHEKGGRERENKWCRRSGGMAESANIEGQRHQRRFLSAEGVLFFLWVFFFTSECWPVFSSWRSGGGKENAASSHPRTSSFFDPRLQPEEEKQRMLSCRLQTIYFSIFDMR